MSFNAQEEIDRLTAERATQAATLAAAQASVAAIQTSLNDQSVIISTAVGNISTIDCRLAYLNSLLPPPS